MRTISLFTFWTLLMLPTLAFAGSYNANGGYCNMVATRDNFDVYHRYKIKKGVVSMMVDMDVGRKTVSLFRCCDYYIKYFRYIDSCRLPKHLEYIDEHGFTHYKSVQ